MTRILTGSIFFFLEEQMLVRGKSYMGALLWWLVRHYIARLVVIIKKTVSLTWVW